MNLTFYKYYFQDAPEGVHKPSDRQLNTKSTSSSPTADSTAVNLNSTGTTAVNMTSSVSNQPVNQSTNQQQDVSHSSSSSNSHTPTEKTNAETQTALRGVAILEGDCGHTHTTSFGHSHFSGSSPRVHEEAVFFTECECKLQKNKSVKSTSAVVGGSLVTSPPLTSGVGQSAVCNGNSSCEQTNKHSASTPNVAALSNPRPSRDPRLNSQKKSNPIKSNSRNRKYSLSPVRRTDLPGSPDVDFHPLVAESETTRHTTILSPVKKSVSGNNVSKKA